MTTNDKKVWGIRAGQTGNADSLFLNGNCIAVGIDKVGDLSIVPNDWNSFKETVAKSYPDYNPRSVSLSAGILFRFIHEMQIGDYIVYPSKVDKFVHLGIIEGSYGFKPSNENSYPHQRTIKWLKANPRNIYSQGALYEIGSLLSLFQIKNFSSEFIKSITNESQQIIVDDFEQTITPVAENVEQNTEDFILKRLAAKLKGYPFQGFIANLLNTMGYRTNDCGEGPDGGLDIIAEKDKFGVDPHLTIKVQVKSCETTIGRPAVSQLMGLLSPGEFGLLVTLGPFTKDAGIFAKERRQIRLVDGSQLVNLILEHYDQLDPKFKSIIPLKRVFVPVLSKDELPE